MRQRRYAEMLHDEFMSISNPQAPLENVNGFRYPNWSPEEPCDSRPMTIVPVRGCPIEDFHRELASCIGDISVGLNDTKPSSQDFNDNIADIVCGKHPEWRLVEVEVSRSSIFLNYGHARYGVTEYVELIVRDQLRFGLKLAPNQFGFVPTYEIDARYYSYCSEPHVMEVREDLGYVYRRIKFGDTDKKNDCIVYLEIEECCGI